MNPDDENQTLTEYFDELRAEGRIYRILHNLGKSCGSFGFTSEWFNIELSPWCTEPVAIKNPLVMAAVKQNTKAKYGSICMKLAVEGKNKWFYGKLLHFKAFGVSTN